jgi:hypothetical protein
LSMNDTGTTALMSSNGFSMPISISCPELAMIDGMVGGTADMIAVIT